MIYKSILVQRKFSVYSNFLDTTLQAEVELGDQDKVEDAMGQVNDKLEKIASEFRKESESIRGVVVKSEEEPAHYRTINYKDRDYMEKRIDDAGTLEEMDAINKEYPVMPFMIKKSWNEKYEKLKNNG